MAKRDRKPMFEVRRSRVHGRGVFALRRIRTGTRILEYIGERISHEHADARYAEKTVLDNHTFLYIVDRKTVIDAGVGGNAARFINHSCNGNCETIIENKRLYIDARCTIQPGEELSYDYRIEREVSDPTNVDEIYACRCGSGGCRGSMLWPAKRAATRPMRSSAQRPKKNAARAARA